MRKSHVKSGLPENEWPYPYGIILYKGNCIGNAYATCVHLLQTEDHTNWRSHLQVKWCVASAPTSHVKITCATRTTQRDKQNICALFVKSHEPRVAASGLPCVANVLCIPRFRNLLKIKGNLVSPPKKVRTFMDAKRAPPHGLKVNQQDSKLLTMAKYRKISFILKDLTRTASLFKLTFWFHSH